MKDLNVFIIEKLKINKKSKNTGKYNVKNYEYKITDISLTDYIEWFLGQDRIIEIDDNFIDDIIYNSNLPKILFNISDIESSGISKKQTEELKDILNSNLDEDIIVYQRKTNSGIENLLDVSFTEKEVYFYSTDYFDKKRGKIEKL